MSTLIKMKPSASAKHTKLYVMLTILSLSILFGLLLIPGIHAVPPAPSIYLKPANQSLAAGTSFTVEIHENSGATNVNAVQANLTYPVANLTLNSIDYSTSAFSIQAQSSGSNGTINIARGQPGGVTGDQIIAVLHFTATTNGTPNISFTSGTGLASSAANTNILPGLSSTAGDAVTIAAQPAVTLSASPVNISLGQSSSLTWASVNTTSCSATTPNGWTASTATSGSQTVSPTTTTTYVISCTGAGGTVQATASVIIPGTLGLDHDLGSGHWSGTGGSLTTTTAASSATRVVVTVSYWTGSTNVGSVKVGGASATLDKRSSSANSGGGTDVYEIWSIPEVSGLASGSTITASLPSGVGGILMGAISLTGVDLTAGGGVTSVAGSSNSGISFSSGTVTNAGGILVGGAGNETNTSSTATLGAGTKVHDLWDSSAMQGMVDGYSIGGTNIAGTFSVSSPISVGAAVSYKAAGIGGGGTTAFGDLNGDGRVNVFDLSILLSHWQQSGGTIPGDLNSDNIVNIFDLSILLSHYGA